MVDVTPSSCDVEGPAGVRRALSYEAQHPQKCRVLLHPVVHLTVTPPGGRKIDGEYQHLRACGNGSFNHAFDEAAVFEHIELEPRGNAGLQRDLVHIAHPHGRQRKRNPAAFAALAALTSPRLEYIPAIPTGPRTTGNDIA